MSDAIAIVGLACRYPDADSPSALWELVLAQRRAFRRMPPERLPIDDYGGAADAPDLTYGTDAAVLTDWQFDRAAFRIAGPTFRTVDPSHWLALECAARALDDAGFGDGEGLPRESTAVIVGNTLTGDYSRAAALRLRWPYVRRALDGALGEAGVDGVLADQLLERAEALFKDPLPPVTEETLAGWLSNTIAGRICNHYGLGGGGYVVDGACSSSLLAVTTACDALRAGTADVVLAGGVDLSLDPFELVGFAKTQALADGEMRVYDREARGFTPGEGCGLAVLMREADARARGCRIYACVRGWGISSDGRGGITRPEVDGQRRALRRAYRLAGYGIDSVAYFEGHGTGTPVGDAAEIAALTEERRQAGASAPAALGSIKANIGHTKAAAGIAGFIKAALALHTQIVPPTTGCPSPHATLDSPDATLRIEPQGRLWPAARPLRASVSAMGFGGINAHVALEAPSGERRGALSARETTLLRAHQDHEVFPFAAADRTALLDAVRAWRQVAASCSRAELTDAAVAMQALHPQGPARAALVVATPKEADAACARLESAIAAGERLCLPAAGIFLGDADRSPRVALLFPGQASPAHADGGAWRRRFALIDALYAAAGSAQPHESTDTAVAQPAIVRASIGGLRMLRALGIEATVAVGHSLGELCALHWAGALDEAALVRLVDARAASMAAHGTSGGGMAGITAPVEAVLPWLADADIVIAAVNGPAQTVISGPLDAVRDVVERCRKAGLTASLLRVSHAFHSPAMTAAADAFAAPLGRERLQRPHRSVMSTVTGAPLEPGADLRALLLAQLVSPVRFDDAIAAIDGVDLFVEAGPGHVLTDLVAARGGAPCVALDAGGPSVRGLLNVAGAAHALGADLDWSALTRERFARPFDLSRRPRVLVNPCETQRVPSRRAASARRIQPRVESPAPAAVAGVSQTPAQIACAVVARRAELPAGSVSPAHRLLSDLHLNSISATQVIVEIARELSVELPPHPAHYTDASIAAIVEALTTQANGKRTDAEPAAAGVASWVRTFQVEWIEEARQSGPRRTGPTAIAGLPHDPLVIALRDAVAHDGPGGTIVCLPDRPGGDGIVALLREARASVERRGPFVVVQRRDGGGAAARSIWLENPGRDVAVINVESDGRATAEAIVEEARACTGFVEVQLRDGRRATPCAVPVEWVSSAPALGASDVLLVTGGGKGITVECALALASRTDTRLGILGRAEPDSDPGLARNLARIEGAGIFVHYAVCDVTDAAAVRTAVREIEGALGPVTAVLHGAAINEPRVLADLDEATIRATIATKVDGLRHVLAAVDPSRLRLCAGFGSLIARTGMRGDSHYAAANELMATTLDDWGAAHPDCRCLTLEWSVWAGAGMGERLNSLAALEREGIVPLTIDQGTAAFCDLLASPARGRVIVTGRFPQGPTLRLAGGEPPLSRFLERPMVWYPGVEIVAEAELTPSSDVYLDDHVLDGDRVLPGVIGLEAMAQAAAALASGPLPPDVVFADVVFERPIVVPADRSRIVRVAALRRGDWFDVVLRSDETRFAVDHFRARCRFVTESWPEAGGVEADAGEALADATPLYADLLFQRGRFQRVTSYRDLHATSCRALVAPPSEQRWFSAFLPGEMIVADPGGHDAALHAVQACVPESRLLPIGVDRIRLRRAAAASEIRAVERGRNGRTYAYDITAIDDRGRICGEWRGARFSEIAGATLRDGWIPELVVPALERAAATLSGDSSVRAFVSTMGAPVVSGRAVMSARLPGVLGSRPDGRPEIAGRHGPRVSIAHDGALVLAVMADGSAIGCDLQACDPRPPGDWFGLLGREGWQLAEFVSAHDGERTDVAASRVWCARECLIKAGLPSHARLASRGRVDGWSIFASDAAHVITRSFPLRPDGRAVMVALLLGAPAAAERSSPEAVA